MAIHPKGGSALTALMSYFCVEIADSTEEWQMGLMFRKRLNPQSGMLFIYPRSDIHTMWMKNTPLSLDMLFINENGIVTEIAENTTPFSHTVIGPKQPVKAVLELKAGSAKKFGIKPGHSVHHRAFGLKNTISCIP